MKPLKLLVLINCCLCFETPAKAQSTTDSLLSQLNAVLANKQFYVNKKTNEIARLNSTLLKAKTPADQYIIYQSLYEEYKSFSYDSAYTYAKKLLEIAIELKEPRLIASAKMKLAFTLLSSGLFKETLEQLNRIDVQLFTNTDKIAYYFLKARTYFDLSDYDRSVDYSAIYNPMGINCIDSALVLCGPGSFNYLQLEGLKDLHAHRYDAGMINYAALLKFANITPHDFAVNACCLSYIDEIKGLHEKSLQLLIRAAIADIQSATKETVAIYKVADVLYKKGDIENGYAYMKQAMDDATFYGALQRQVKIGGILPIIETQRMDQVEYQKRLLYAYAVIITLLVIFVLVFAWIIFKQLKKLRIADEVIKAANVSLQNNNKVLEELNRNLSTANKIKNEYIGYYFNINSIYIEKLESFQKSIDKKLSSKRYDDARAAVQNLNLENERQLLFHTFDKVFLRLFPGFIDKFNALFHNGNRICVPEGQLLSTEHRIFALIRMGIHDNDRIARLLSYSVNTIYSYKNRIKNKSFIANEEFEHYVMDIEAV